MVCVTQQCVVGVHSFVESVERGGCCVFGHLQPAFLQPGPAPTLPSVCKQSVLFPHGGVATVSKGCPQWVQRPDWMWGGAKVNEHGQDFSGITFFGFLAVVLLATVQFATAR